MPAMLVTDWPHLREADWAAAAIAGPVLFDGRSLLDPAAMAASGCTYLSVGGAPTAAGGFAVPWV